MILYDWINEEKEDILFKSMVSVKGICRDLERIWTVTLLI